MSLRDPCLVEPRPNGGEPIGDVVDRYLAFVAARCRPNTVAAARFDTSPEFATTIQAQHDHAAAHAQTTRVELYGTLLERLGASR